MGSGKLHFAELNTRGRFYLSQVIMTFSVLYLSLNIQISFIVYRIGNQKVIQTDTVAVKSIKYQQILSIIYVTILCNRQTILFSATELGFLVVQCQSFIFILHFYMCFVLCQYLTKSVSSVGILYPQQPRSIIDIVLDNINMSCCVRPLIILSHYGCSINCQI